MDFTQVTVWIKGISTGVEGFVLRSPNPGGIRTKLGDISAWESVSWGYSDKTWWY